MTVLEGGIRVNRGLHRVGFFTARAQKRPPAFRLSRPGAVGRALAIRPHFSRGTTTAGPLIGPPFPSGGNLESERIRASSGKPIRIDLRLIDG